MEAMVEAPQALLLLPLQFLLSPHPLVLTGPMVPHRKYPPTLRPQRILPHGFRQEFVK